MTTATEEAVLAQAPGTRQAAGSTSIRPFTYHATDAELNDLRRRIKATRWPEKETVADTSQGVPLAPLRDLARYWATDYDWRKCEAKLKGGHFPAWEQPELFAAELRAAFRSLREPQ